MLRLRVLVPLLLLPPASLAVAAPAHAVVHRICVGSPGGTCDQTFATIPLAITAANGNSVDDVIAVGAGTYSDGPYNLNGGAHALTLTGVGPTTVLTLPASASQQIYVVATTATVSDLTVLMAGAQSTNDTALGLNSAAVADHVTVEGSATTGAVGVVMHVASLTHSSVLLGPTVAGVSVGVISQANDTITDDTISAMEGIRGQGSGAEVHTVSRTSIRADYLGIDIDASTVNIDDSVIDLGGPSSSFAGAIGLLAANSNPGTAPKTINADHVTIVGGGASSIGVKTSSMWPTIQQVSTVNLTSSIVRGPATSLFAEASNTLAPGMPSTATISASWSDWHSTGGVIGAGGAGGVVSGAGRLDVDPVFVDPTAGNYRLSAGSPVIDKGSPAAGGPTLDRDGSARVLDGDPTLGAVTDMGAYESPAIAHDTTAPDTTITKKPAKRSTRSTAKVAFTSEAGARFECQVDGKAFKPCTSPLKLKVKVGKHTVLVRAVDAAGNVDPTPAKVKFRRVPQPH